MRIISFFFPHFPLQVELKSDPALARQPIVIGGFPYERRAVFDVSEEAMAYGVKMGVPLRQAHSLCPESVFLPLNEEAYTDAFGAVLDLIAEFTPRMETAGLGEVFVEIPYESWVADMAREIRQTIEEEGGFAAAVACASGKFVAQVGSKITRPDEVMLVPRGKERDFLKNLPIDFLPGSETVLHRLELLSIRKMGQLAKLPRAEVSLEFGTEGERLWDLTRGIDRSKLIPRQLIPIFEGQLDFDPPAGTIDRLLAGAEILTDRLAFQLDERWQCCRRMRVHLNSTEGDGIEVVIDFKQPTASAYDMLRHFKQRLDNVQFDSPVSEIKIEVEHLCAEQGSQLKLLDNLPRRSSDLLVTIKQLQTKYGSPVIKRVIRSTTNTRLPEGAFSFTDYSEVKL